jgi:hypothetical protein
MLSRVMKYGGAILAGAAFLASILGGCNGGGAAATHASDAGSIPPSAYAECDPDAGQTDAATFAYTATCSGSGSDGGPPSSCSQWSESADGDWTPFLESCLAEGGTITSVPCPDAGLSGVCSLPPDCTTQTAAFYYGATQAAAGEAACAGTVGARFTP